MPATATLFWVLLLCLTLIIIQETDGVRPIRSSNSVTHSNFLRAAVRGGRQRNLWCSAYPNVCLDKEKNPWGGTTCCFQSFCKDNMNDHENCGECGHRCGYGFACCGGRCTSLETDPKHCGSCYYSCPGQLECSFAMCGYGGGDL